MIDAAIPWALCRQIGMNRLMRRLEGIYTQSARHAQYTVVLLIVLVDGTKADVHVLQATKRVAVLVMHLRMCLWTVAIHVQNRPVQIAAITVGCVQGRDPVAAGRPWPRPVAAGRSLRSFSRLSSSN